MALKKQTQVNNDSNEKNEKGGKTRLRKGSSNKASEKLEVVNDAVPTEEVQSEVVNPETHADQPEEQESLPAKQERQVTRSGPRDLGTPGGLGIVSPYDVLENAIAPGELEFGSIPRYTASNGLIQDNDKRKIGAWAQFEPVSFNYLYMLAPGENDDEAKEYLKFSYDSIMCNDGSMSMEDAMQEAKDAGYKKAEIKRYVELYGILLSAEKLDDEDKALNKLVMFSLSPESVKLWNGFKAQTAVQIKLGRTNPEDLKIVTAEVIVKTYGDNTFSCFNFEL